MIDPKVKACVEEVDEALRDLETGMDVASVRAAFDELKSLLSQDAIVPTEDLPRPRAREILIQIRHRVTKPGGEEILHWSQYIVNDSATCRLLLSDPQPLGRALRKVAAERKAISTKAEAWIASGKAVTSDTDVVEED